MTKVREAIEQDLRQREALGLRKYGVTLDRQDLTEAQWLQHAYEEALDMACYLKRLLLQKEGRYVQEAPVSES